VRVIIRVHEAPFENVSAVGAFVGGKEETSVVCFPQAPFKRERGQWDAAIRQRRRLKNHRDERCSSCPLGLNGIFRHNGRSPAT
jgi:hypothetical protein